MNMRNTTAILTILTSYNFLLHPVQAAVESSVSGLEEIVITAQRREESLQSTPIAVTAFGEADLQNNNIDNIAQVAEFTPNLMFDETAPLSGATTAAVLYIRGVGQSSYQVTDDPGVGTYVDGVYVGSSVGGVLDVIDVERIEVLRGPQGTLFGRNTIGGAINITTKRPSSEPQAKIEATFGNYKRANARATFDLPVTENLLTKLTVGHKSANGWLELLAESNAANTETNRNQKTPGDDNETSARLSILYTPSDTVSVYVTGDLSYVDEASAPSTLLGVGKNLNDPTFAEDPGVAPAEFSVNHGILNLIYNTTIAPTLNIPGYGVGVTYDDRWVPPNPARQSYRNGVNGTIVDTYGLSATIEWDVADNVTLKSISSFRKVDAQLNRDADGSPLTIVHCFNDFVHEQYSEELQLYGDAFDSRLQWLAGVYYFSEDAVDNFRCQLPFNLLLKASVDNSSIATFGQATYALADNLSLTAGVRWTKDKKSMFPQFGSVDAFDEPETLIPNIPVMEVNDKFTQVTPKVSLDYQVTDNVLTYISFSTGFKSGGFSSRTLVPRDEVLRFTPEKIWTIEGGVKAEGFNRRVRANAAVFYSKYRDIQGTVIEGIAPGTQNIGDSKIHGFELEITAIPVTNLMVNASVGYLHNKYTELSQLSPGVSPDGFIRMTNKLANSPEWSFIGGIDYTIPAPGLNGDFVIRGDYTFYSSIWNDELNSELLKQDSYGLLGAQLAYIHQDGRWGVILWGKNLTDEKYIVSGDDNIYAGFREANFGTPRTYGVTVRHEF